MPAYTLKYNTLDVFTSAPFEGNQLGLVHVPASVPLSQEQMQAIAIEFNYSETVFLHEKTSTSSVPTYEAQIFTPKSELPFAGHPTIGTAVFVFANLEKETDQIILNLKAGPVKATFDRETQQARCEIPQEAHTHAAKIPGDRVGAVNPGLATSEWLKSASFHSGSIVRGLNFAFIDLSSHPADLDLVRVTKDNIMHESFLDPGWPADLMADVFYSVAEPDQNNDDGVIRVQQRVIVIELEDPATGSASGALTSHLALRRGGPGKTYTFELEQGVKMGRRSVIGAQVTLSADGKAVSKVALIGGATEVMEGVIKF